MATKQQVPVLVARLVEHQVDFELMLPMDAQWAIQNTKEAIAICIKAIENRDRSFLTKSFKPEEFFDDDWRVWKGPADGNGIFGEEDIDPRSLTLSEIKLSRLVFKRCKHRDEKSIMGEERLRRLKEEDRQFIRLGGNVFSGLWEDYNAQNQKEYSILEVIYRKFKVSLINFPGIVLRSPQGERHGIYLYRDDSGRRNWYPNWYDYDLSANYASAIYAV